MPMPKIQVRFSADVHPVDAQWRVECARGKLVSCQYYTRYWFKLQLLNTYNNMPQLTDARLNSTVILANLSTNTEITNILRGLGLLLNQPFRICAINFCCVIVQCQSTRIGISRAVADTITVHTLD